MENSPALAGAAASQVAADGAGNGYIGLIAKFNILQKAATALAEEAELVADRMRDAAGVAVRLADLSVEAQVDARHVAAIADISEAFARTVGGVKAVMAAADDMQQAAANVKETHRSEHGGMHAASVSSRARQAKPGFYQLP